MSEAQASYHSGFVGIVGKPNVGKSTILNFYLGEKIAITTPKPQTTRNRILGVLTNEEAQVVFLDTPGLNKPHHVLGRYMQEMVKAAIDEADVLVAVVDSQAGLTEDDERVFTRIKDSKKPVFLALNKVDVVRKSRLLPLIDDCAKRQIFRECVPVSALTGDQMGVLLNHLVGTLPEGPRWYESDKRTDQTTRQLIAEFIREQVMIAVHQEVPHAMAVLVEKVEERDKVTAIYATILVERSGQKAIVIGHGGSMLKRIGQAARQELERLIGRKVYLELWVKVAEDWRSDAKVLRELGYA